MNHASLPVGPADAAQRWRDISAAQRTELKAYAAAKDCRILLSLGGGTDATDWPGGVIMTGMSNKSIWDSYVDLGINFVRDYDLDGLDFDVEARPMNQAIFTDGYMMPFMTYITERARQYLPRPYILAAAPMGPYLSTTYAGPDENYLTWWAANGHHLDFLAIQYYNQNSYAEYHDVFTNSDYTGSSVAELHHDWNVPLEKIVVGKVTDPSYGWSSPSYWPFETLRTAGCRAVEEIGQFGGYMTWMFNNDREDITANWANVLNRPCPNAVCDWPSQETNGQEEEETETNPITSSPEVEEETSTESPVTTDDDTSGTIDEEHVTCPVCETCETCPEVEACETCETCQVCEACETCESCPEPEVCETCEECDCPVTECPAPVECPNGGTEKPKYELIYASSIRQNGNCLTVKGKKVAIQDSTKSKRNASCPVMWKIRNRAQIQQYGSNNCITTSKKLGRNLNYPLIIAACRNDISQAFYFDQETGKIHSSLDERYCFRSGAKGSMMLEWARVFQHISHENLILW